MQMSVENQRRAAAAVFICGLAWVFYVQPRLGSASSEEYFWTLLLFILCCFPIVLHSGGHHERIPIMPLWGILYFATFSPTTLDVETFQLTFFLLPVELVTGALRTVVIGGAACLAMYYSPLGLWAERSISKAKVSWNAGRAMRYGVRFSLIGLAVAWLVQVAELPKDWIQIILLGVDLGTAGTLCLLILNLRGQLPISHCIFLWGMVIPVKLLLALQTGLLYQVIWVLEPLLLCYAAERRRIPWAAIAVGGALLVPLSTAKGEFRSSAWYGEDTEIAATGNPLRRGMAYVELAYKRYMEGGEPEVLSDRARLTEARATQLVTIVSVTEMTPQAVPFWYGETYGGMVWALIPRPVFPGKPVRVLGQTFGHRYGLLDPDDFTTSYNLPYQVVEMYANFGLPGVIIGMGLLGALFRAVATLLGHPEATEREWIIGSVLLPGPLTIESDFCLVFARAFYLVTFLLIMLRPLVRSPTRPAGAWSERAAAA